MSERNRRIVLARRPHGLPQPEDFRLETGPVPEAGEGEVLLRTVWLSLDPYMRGRMNDAPSYAPPVGLGEVMVGGGGRAGGGVAGAGLCRGRLGGGADGLAGMGGGRAEAAAQVAGGGDGGGGAGVGGAGRAGDAGDDRLGRTAQHRAAQAGRDGGGGGGERAGGGDGGADRAAARGAGGGDRGRGGEVRLCARRAGLRGLRGPSRSRVAGAVWPRPARTGSTCTGRMWAGRCGTRCCRCSIRSRGCRCAGWWRTRVRRSCRRARTGRRY